MLQWSLIASTTDGQRLLPLQNQWRTQIMDPSLWRPPTSGTTLRIPFQLWGRRERLHDLQVLQWNRIHNELHKQNEFIIWTKKSLKKYLFLCCWIDLDRSRCSAWRSVESSCQRNIRRINMYRNWSKFWGLLVNPKMMVGISRFFTCDYLLSIANWLRLWITSSVEQLWRMIIWMHWSNWEKFNESIMVRYLPFLLCLIFSTNSSEWYTSWSHTNI